MVQFTRFPDMSYVFTHALLDFTPVQLPDSEIHGYAYLPPSEAYRSLSRPSSAPNA